MQQSHAKKRLHFMHIFKTGGTSLRPFFQLKFESKVVCPADFICEGPYGTSPTCILKNIPANILHQYRFFMGHLGWMPRTFFPDDEMETIVFLRDPYERVLSEYAQICKMAEKIPNSKRFKDINEYIYNPHYISNRQTLYFCMDQGFEENHETSLSDSFNFDLMGFSNWMFPLQNERNQNQMLELAIERLHSCDFIGITEQYAASLERLCEQYNWLLPNKVPKENSTPTLTKNANLSNLSTKGRDRIMELNHFDRILYQEAIKISKERNSTRVFINGETNRRKCYESLPSHNEIQFTFEDQVVGEGWGMREYNESNCFCWSTALTSTLFFSIKARCDLSVQLHISHYLAPDFDKILRLFANSHPIKLFSQSSPNGGLLFVGVIPLHALNEDSTTIELSFSLPNLTSPKDVNPESDDIRKLGFICKSIEIKPLIQTHCTNDKGYFNLFKSLKRKIKLWVLN